jgi:hypothetical protein
MHSRQFCPADSRRQLVPRIRKLLWVVCLVSVGCGKSEQAGSTSPGSVDPPPLAAAQFTYPTAGSVIDPFRHFKWTTVNGAVGYYFQIGSTPGGHDIFNVGNLPPNITEWAVDNLMPGNTYHATLKTVLPNNTFLYSDISFTAADQPSPPDANAFYSMIRQLTGSVRVSADLSSNIPTPGTPLATEVALRGRTKADCTDYSYTLIDLLQQQHIYSRRVVLSLVGNFWIGHTVVEYYDPFRSKWSVTDPTFGVMYFDDGTQTGQSAAELSDEVFTESFSSIQPKFLTPKQDEYLKSYYLDPITLFLNIVPEGSTPEQSVLHDPLQFMLPGSVGVPGFYAFEFADSSGTMQIINPPGQFASGAITVKAEDGTRWSPVAALNDGWTIENVAAGSQVFTMRRVIF